MGAEESEGGPAAEDVRRSLLRMITSGALKPGERLGTEREMSEQFKVSRATVRSAILPLDRAGVLERRTGRAGGTFVRAGVVERDIAEQLGLPARLAAGGHTTSTRVLRTARRPARAIEAQALGLDSGEDVVVLERLRYADGLPLSLDTACFPAALVPDLLEQPLGGSVYDLVRMRYGLAPEQVQEEMTIVAAKPREAKELEVAVRAPLMQLVRVSRDREGRAFEYAEDLFRADRVRLVARRTSSVRRSQQRADDGLIELTISA